MSEFNNLMRAITDRQLALMGLPPLKPAAAHHDQPEPQSRAAAGSEDGNAFVAGPICHDDGKPCPAPKERGGRGNSRCEQNGVCQRVDFNNLPRLIIEIGKPPVGPDDLRGSPLWDRLAK